MSRRSEPEGPVARAGRETFDDLPLLASESVRVARRSRTQDAAAAEAAPHRSGTGARILEFLRAHWPDGFTRPQLAEALGVKVNTVNGRVSELRSPVFFGAERLRAIFAGDTSGRFDDRTRPIPPPLYEDGERDGCALVRAYHAHPLTIQECVRVITSNQPK